VNAAHPSAETTPYALDREYSTVVAMPADEQQGYARVEVEEIANAQEEQDMSP